MQEDAQQIRDFINVHDVVSAHLIVLQNSQADYQVFNIGSGLRTKVFDLAKKVCQLAGVRFQPIIEGVFRINAPRHSIMDINKLKNLGWQPKYTLEDSVKEYLGWIKKHPEAIKYWQKTYKKMQLLKILKS